MAAGQKLYPRATLKKIVKAHSRMNVSKNADVLVSHATDGLVVGGLPWLTIVLSRSFSTMRSSYRR